MSGKTVGVGNESERRRMEWVEGGAGDGDFPVPLGRFYVWTISVQRRIFDG